MAELVCERAEARGRAVEAHHDERVRARRTRGERAAHLALVRIDVDPALLEAPAATVATYSSPSGASESQIQSTHCS